MPTEALNADQTSSDAWQWWEARRPRYNLGLAAGGFVAWALFVLEVAVARPILLDRLSLDLSLSMTLGQGLAFLTIMAVANVCYLAGALSETVLKPSDAAGYRRRMWGLGFWLSFALPFLFPALILVNLLSIAGL